MNIVIIPARIGSKRIKKKNIKIFNSKPIIYWTLKNLKESGIFDLIIVSSDSNEILNISKKFNSKIKLIKRPKKLANDYALARDVIKHAILHLKNRIKIDIVSSVYPCNPFLNVEKIKESIILVKKKPTYMIHPVISYNHPIERALILKNKIICPVFPNKIKKRTQDCIKTYHDIGQFYTAKKETWLKADPFKKRIGLENLSWETVDIDDEDDWKKAEIFHKIINHKKK